MFFTFLAILVHDPLLCPSSSKIDRVMAILVHDPSYSPELPTSDAPDQSVFAKFWASSSKIDQVMSILVTDLLLRP